MLMNACIVYSDIKKGGAVTQSTPKSVDCFYFLWSTLTAIDIIGSVWTFGFRKIEIQQPFYEWKSVFCY